MSRPRALAVRLWSGRRGDRRGRSGGGGHGGGPTDPGGVVGDRLNLGVGEVGDLDAAGDAALGEQQGFALVFGFNVVGVVALLGPALAEDDVGAVRGGAAERAPVAEDVPQRGGDDVEGRPLGGGDDDDPGGPAPSDEVAQQGGEFLLLLLGADGGRVVGDLVDHGDDDRHAVGAGDLAAVVRA